MVDLKAKPYCLSDEDIAWVHSTIANMTDEEKVGQLFFDHDAQTSDEDLRKKLDRFHIGGYRYNGITCAQVQHQVNVLQEHAKIPLFVACNTETGGAGTGVDGTYIGKGLKIGATNDPKYAYEMARMGNEEAACMGNNMAFAPVCDIHYNWQNTEIVQRCFGSDVDRVAAMSKAYMDGVHAVPGFASVAKHFPGNGQDFRDAHFSNNINNFDKKHWMETYGKVYKTLIDGGLDGIMGGHIMMPAYMQEVKPGITYDEMLPATLCPEIMTGLLRDELGFNGMVVTDASHMVGMTDRMAHADMVVAAINAGCDMYLFFNDPEEDFHIMLDAYRTGKISQERMTEALTRILGLKAKLGLNKKTPADLVLSEDTLKATVGRQEYRDMASEISDKAITLVKYKDADVLPLTPEKYKKIMIVPIKGYEGPMDKLMALGAKGRPAKPSVAQQLCDLLKAKGFDAFLYEGPMERAQRLMAEGKKVGPADIYHSGKVALADFKAQQDLVITLFDVSIGRPAFGMTKGGGEIPWYVNDVPTIGISVNAPTMLADVPMLRTYINAYDSTPSTLSALTDKLTTGKEAFTGVDPIDSFCGLWDTHI